MAVQINTLRSVLRAGQSSLGSICGIPSPDCAEAIARIGFDWLFLDTQHGLAGREALVNMIRALDIAATPSLVRVPWNRPEFVGWALDAGAHGIVAPMINTADDARSFVAACRYAPTGSRSWGPARPALRGGYSTEQGDQSITCVMIETAEALENLDDILGVKGVDSVLVGQSDLCISYGLHPSTGRTDTKHRGRLEQIQNACRKSGVAVVINCANASEARAVMAIGFQHLMVGSDMALLRQSAAALLSETKALMQAPR